MNKSFGNIQHDKQKVTPDQSRTASALASSSHAHSAGARWVAQKYKNVKKEKKKDNSRWLVDPMTMSRTKTKTSWREG